jgi:hypothetical protein
VIGIQVKRYDHDLAAAAKDPRKLGEKANIGVAFEMFERASERGLGYATGFERQCASIPAYIPAMNTGREDEILCIGFASHETFDDLRQRRIACCDIEKSVLSHRLQQLNGQVVLEGLLG